MAVSRASGKGGRAWHIVPAVVLALVLASCSGGDPDRSSAPSDDPPAGAEPIEPTVLSSGDDPAAGRSHDDDERVSDPAADDAVEFADDESDGPRFASGDHEFLFDQARLHTFEIDLPSASLAELDADPTAEQYVEGRLTFDGEVVESIGVRYKGSVGAFVGCTDGPNPLAPSGAKTCTKLSMKLKINWDDSDRTFYGVRRVQLHSQNLDPSMMHERLGYWMYREMGVPAPRSTHARVVVNGEYLGVFALTEQIDGRFTRATFDDGKGNLYKEVWPFDASGAPTAPERFIAAVETNKSSATDADIVTSFAAELAAADPGDRIAVIERWADLETLLTTIVVDRAIRHDDGPLHWYCARECAPHNFYWYEEPSTRRVWLIPWDLDNAFETLLDNGSVVGSFIRIADPFGAVTNDCEPFTAGTFGVPQRSAACDVLLGVLASLDDDYDRVRGELLAGPFSETSVDAQLAAWTTQIAGAVAEAAAAHDDAPTVAEWEAAVEALRASLTTSREGSGR